MARVASTVEAEGCVGFRRRIALSTLSGRSVQIDEIRAGSSRPGLCEYEANFLRLVESLSNGCRVQINDTGTRLRFRPGVVTGGSHVHVCNTARSVGYYIEGILPLLPFAKSTTTILFKGAATHDAEGADFCVDTLRDVTLPLLRRFGLEGALELNLRRRASPPTGGGEVILTCKPVRALRPFQLVDPGFVKRVRGVAYATRVSPQTCNRMVSAAREIFNGFLPDVYVATDAVRGKLCGKDPGFGVQLTAETTTGCVLSAECVATQGVLPEELGRRTAELLCEEIAKGGCVDASHQPLCCLMMAITPEDVSKVRVGQLSAPAIIALRDIRAFLGTVFKITPQIDRATGCGTVTLACLGSGLSNVSKAVC